ncbi:MAG: NF038396 family protein [Galactobacter sp.]
MAAPTEPTPLSQRQETWFLLGYMLLPILGLVTVAMGIWSIIIDRKILGVILIVVFTQVFVWGAVYAIGKRKKLLSHTLEDIDAQMSDEEAIDAFNAREALAIEEREKAERERRGEA